MSLHRSAAARALRRLASCCEHRRRQLEELADRCSHIGLQHRDVVLLSDIAGNYKLFRHELLQICDKLKVADLGAVEPGDGGSDATINEAFRAVMESSLSSRRKRAVRQGYRRTCNGGARSEGG
jgi:hypothetical protein